MQVQVLPSCPAGANPAPPTKNKEEETMKNSLEAAIDSLKEHKDWRECMTEQEEQAVQFALKFTKAALSGEVSGEVMKAATDSYSINGRFALLSHFKAMCQQLAKEVGNG